MGSESSKIKENVKVLMPIYLYPDEMNMEIYRRVVKSSDNLQMTLIVNPNNGHDSIEAPNSDWEKVVKEIANINSVGYVHLSYMKRDLSLVRKEIQGYAKNGWKVKGIFFDEAPSDLSHLQAIRRLSEFTHHAFGKDNVKVFLNPGVPVHKKYFDFADGVVIFENFYRHFDRVLFRHRKSTSKKSAVIIRGVPDTKITPIMNELKDCNVGYVFMTGVNCEFHTPVRQYFFEKIGGFRKD
eukprot:g1206.t1